MKHAILVTPQAIIAKTYGRENNGLFIYKNDEFVPISPQEVETHRLTIQSKGWRTVKGDSKEAAMTTLLDRLAVEIAEKKELEALLQLDVIPTTIGNLQILMNHLNSFNWGLWTLPRMSVGYSAQQYDCDGSLATTVILDRPLNGRTHFVLGGKRGHLTKYTDIGRL